MTARSARAAALAGALLAAIDVRAASLEGVEFRDRFASPELELELRGIGLLRYRVVFKAYVAGLYLEPGADTAGVLDDVPKRLEIEYFWPIRAEAFGRAASDLLAQRLEPDALADLEPRIERLHDLYRDVEPGDRYALTYAPGVGTELSLNGEPLGRVAGADLASAYFGIWLGESPLDESLRRQLLRAGEPRGP